MRLMIRQTGLLACAIHIYLPVSTGLSQNNGDLSLIADFIVQSLEDAGYWASRYEVDALRFGSTQKRMRLYFVAVKFDTEGLLTFKDRIAAMGLNLLNSMEVG